MFLILGVISISATTSLAFTCETEEFENGSSVTYCDNYYTINSTVQDGAACYGPDSDCAVTIYW